MRWEKSMNRNKDERNKIMKDCGRFEVFDAVLIKILVFRDMIPCRVVHSYNICIHRHFLKTYCR
jgi:hypothetical protein